VRRLAWHRFDHVAVSQGSWDELTSAPFRDLDRHARSYSIAYHSYNEEGAPRRPEDLRRLARGARANFFASARARDVLSARLGMELPNVVFFHNALSFEPPVTPPPWPDASGPLRLVGIGTLHCASKGQDLLLRALASSRWRARAWTLDLYGDGSDRAAIAALARELRVDDRVALHGHVKDLRNALAAAHLLVQPSRIEAVGISVHEAMVTARPCLVTALGDMPRWIREGESGFVAERPDAGAVERALERAWSARDRLADMGRRARADFLARFPKDPVGEFARLVLDAAAPAGS
jgi:glycosyltransferase involved in cell wall biosynthesis